ncbi:hypothetical protein [Streptomyces sp. NPDC003943]
MNRRQRIISRSIAGLTAAALVLGAAPVALAATGDRGPGQSTTTSSEDTSAALLAKALQVVEAMPDAVIAEGDAAVRAYLGERLLLQPETRGLWQGVKCGTAIVGALASGAIPAAKILKLKAFIAKAGGVKNAAYLLIRVAKGEEKLSELGATLGGLAGAVLGIDQIQKQCS